MQGNLISEVQKALAPKHESSVALYNLTSTGPSQAVVVGQALPPELTPEGRFLRGASTEISAPRTSNPHRSIGSNSVGGPLPNHEALSGRIQVQLLGPGAVLEHGTDFPLGTIPLDLNVLADIFGPSDFPDPWGHPPGPAEAEGTSESKGDHQLFVRIIAGKAAAGSSQIVYELHAGIAGPNPRGYKVEHLYICEAYVAKRWYGTPVPYKPGGVSPLPAENGRWDLGIRPPYAKITGTMNGWGDPGPSVGLIPGDSVRLSVCAEDTDKCTARANLAIAWI